MSRKLYDGYEYVDSDEQYTYPNSSVLINKFEIKNQDVAHEKEYHLARNRGLDLFLSPILVHSMKDVLAIHKFLFQEMYTWAGQYRKVNISKQGNAFMALQAFDSGETYMDALIKKFHDTAYSKDAIIQQLADILDNLNYIHPFREGNGRTQREVIRALALAKGYYADINLDMDDEIYHLYMDGTVYADKQKLQQMFMLILEETEE